VQGERRVSQPEERAWVEKPSIKSKGRLEGLKKAQCSWDRALAAGGRRGGRDTALRTADHMRDCRLYLRM